MENHLVTVDNIAKAQHFKHGSSGISGPFNAAAGLGQLITAEDC